MSIDARVKTVIVNEDGSGRLVLVDRPPSRPGDSGGIAGQKILGFRGAPEEVTALNGLDIWGSDSSLMLGVYEIATRYGYQEIGFVGREFFNRAVANYHIRKRA